MTSLTFRQFLRRQGITMFILSIEDTIPGTLIEKRKRGYYPYGHINDIFRDPEDDWKTVLRQANLATADIERKLSLKGKSSLKEFGIQIQGGLQKAKSVQFIVSGVKARKLKEQNRLKIESRLASIRASGHPQWNLIRKKWLADFVYYATEFTASFEVERGLDLEAELSQRIRLPIDASVSWSSKTTFHVSKNQKVPFGFSGWKLG